MQSSVQKESPLKQAWNESDFEVREGCASATIVGVRFYFIFFHSHTFLNPVHA
jgi:hypothetical protein